MQTGQIPHNPAMDFQRVLSTLAGFFRRGEFRWAVAGGVALQAYGFSRMTNDLDLVVESESAPEIVRFLESLGFETLQGGPHFSNHLHGDPSWGRVDLVWIRGETARRLFSEARLLGSFGETEIPCVSPEHLAAMKAAAMANDPGRRFGDLADVRFLLQRSDVDRQRIRDYFRKYGSEHWLDELEETL